MHVGWLSPISSCPPGRGIARRRPLSSSLKARRAAAQRAPLSAEGRPRPARLSASRRGSDDADFHIGSPRLPSSHPTAGPRGRPSPASHLLTDDFLKPAARARDLSLWPSLLVIPRSVASPCRGDRRQGAPRDGRRHRGGRAGYAVVRRRAFAAGGSGEPQDWKSSTHEGEPPVRGAFDAAADTAAGRVTGCSGRSRRSSGVAARWSGRRRSRGGRAALALAGDVF